VGQVVDLCCEVGFCEGWHAVKGIIAAWGRGASGGGDRKDTRRPVAPKREGERSITEWQW
jgi:hypothetical protein